MVPYKIKKYSNEIINIIDTGKFPLLLQYLTTLQKKCPNPINWGLNSVFLLNEDGIPSLSILHYFVQTMLDRKDCYIYFNYYYRILEILLLFGANSNHINNGHTPASLILASKNLNLEFKYYFLQLFVKHQLDISIMYSFGSIISLIPDIDNKFVFLLLDLLYIKLDYDNVYQQPLFIFKNHKIVEYLINVGESPKIYDYSRNTPVHLLFDKNHLHRDTDLHKTLIAYAKFINLKSLNANISGQYILHCFVKDNKFSIHKSFKKCIHFLINYGFDINQTDDELKHNVLFFANINHTNKCKSNIKNCISLMKFLIKSGANINHQNIYLRTIAYNCNLHIFKFLIRAGLNFKLLDITGRPLILQIVEKDYYNHFSDSYLEEFGEKIKCLLKYGLDLNDTDAEGDTILHYIFNQGIRLYKSIFFLLYSNGANLLAKNSNNFTPLYGLENKDYLLLFNMAICVNDSKLFQEILSNFNSKELDYFFKECLIDDPKSIFTIKLIQEFISERIHKLCNVLIDKGIPTDVTKYVLSKMIYP